MQKYIGDGSAPNLNKLSGNDWKNTKARAKAAVTDMAHDLLELSAKNERKRLCFFRGFAVAGGIEESFPHTETDEQLRCIEEIKVTWSGRFLWTGFPGEWDSGKRRLPCKGTI